MWIHVGLPWWRYQRSQSDSHTSINSHLRGHLRDAKTQALADK